MSAEESNSRNGSGRADQAGSQGSRNSSGQDEQLDGHSDQAGPQTQALRDSPPSSQQYSAWNREQRAKYIDEIERITATVYSEEVERIQREASSWQAQFNSALDNIESSILGAMGQMPANRTPLVRVAAVRSNRPPGSQGLDSGSSQRSRSPVSPYNSQLRRDSQEDRQ